MVDLFLNKYYFLLLIYTNINKTMKKFKIISLLLTVLLVSQLNRLNAQAKFSISALSIQDDTTSFNAIDPLNIQVKNTGNQAFTGNLYIYYQTNDTILMPQRMVLDSFNLVNFKAGDSTDVSQPSFIIKAKNFHKFSNIIVIWPIAPNIMYDSAQTKVYVLDSLTGILKQPVQENDPIIYPNPAKSTISIKSTDQKYTIETIRIYDSIGELVKILQGDLKVIDLSSLSHGLYLMEIETNSGRLITKPILRE